MMPIVDWEYFLNYLGEMMEDNKYYCPSCEWFFKPSEVEEHNDGISDTVCPTCGEPLQEEGER